MAVLLDLALSLGQGLTKQDLFEAGATTTQVDLIVRLLKFEAAGSPFLRHPLVSTNLLPPLRFGASAQVLEYSLHGPRLRDN